MTTVAYRGLWDKFAAPCSAGAIRRSLSRGVPTIVAASDLSISNALALASDRAINRDRVPLYLTINGLPSMVLGDPAVPEWLDLYAIVSDGSSATTQPIYVWRDSSWQLAGCYVPVDAAYRGLTPADLGGDARTRPIILFESTNVITDLQTAAQTGGLTDDAIAASLRTLAGPLATIVRISDLVELDLLDRGIREAA